MNWVKDDGGREASGHPKHSGDCVVRAVAIATGSSYQEVWEDLESYCLSGRKRKRFSSPAKGIQIPLLKKYLALKGFRWVPLMGIGTGCRYHLRSDELPSGTLIVNLSLHVAAVVDGVLHDLSDCSRGGTRCVYGYWVRESCCG